MLPDRVSNPGPLTYESGALPIALRGPALFLNVNIMTYGIYFSHYSCEGSWPRRWRAWWKRWGHVPAETIDFDRLKSILIWSSRIVLC